MTPAGPALPPRMREDLALARRLEPLSPSAAAAERIGAAVRTRPASGGASSPRAPS